MDASNRYRGMQQDLMLLRRLRQNKDAGEERDLLGRLEGHLLELMNEIWAELDKARRAKLHWEQPKEKS